MLVAFDALPHCGFGDHFPLIARRVVGDIGPVDGDEDRTNKKRAEGDRLQTSGATRNGTCWQCGEHEHDDGDEGDGGDRLVAARGRDLHAIAEAPDAGHQRVERCEEEQNDPKQGVCDTPLGGETPD